MATALYPVQWVVLQPVQAAMGQGGYFTSLAPAQRTRRTALQRLATQAERAILQLEQLQPGEPRLRELLAMRERITTRHRRPGALRRGRPVFAQGGDRPRTDPRHRAGLAGDRRVGVLGQVTRVYPLVSEVTLLIDRDQAIPVLNTRTGLRSVAFGQPSAMATAWSCATPWPVRTSRKATC
jgi:rod shape-determining protein MreC